MDPQWQALERKVDSMLDPLQQDLRARTERISAAIPIAKAIVDGRKMAKPSFAAERIKALKAAIEAETDKLINEIESVAKNEVPQAFAQGRAALKSQRDDLEALKSELATLTNLPLDSTGSEPV